MPFTLTSFEQDLQTIWYNGALIPSEESFTHVAAQALHYGLSVFEGERAYSGKIFKLEQHNERLFASAEAIGLSISYTPKQLIDARLELLERLKLKDAYIRPLVFSGPGGLGLISPKRPACVAILAWPWGNPLGDNLRLTTSPWRKISPLSVPVQAKAASLYLPGFLSYQFAQKQGFDNALLLDHEGFVAESTGANLFLIREGEVYTPTADRFLNGITRQTLIEIIEQKGIKLHAQRIKPESLNTYEEAFLTGTAAEVTLVKSIDDHVFPSQTLSTELQKSYQERVRA